MNAKPLFSSNLFPLLEDSKETLNTERENQLNMVNVSSETDALEAIKLDPAVLEARVSLHGNNDKAGYNGMYISQNDVIQSNKDKEMSAPKSTKSFEEMIAEHEAALLSLRPDQLELLMKYADTLRKQRFKNLRNFECAFCKKNGRRESWYNSHVLKDERGRVQCPVLRRYRCPRCGATGIYAHTMKYCPQNSLDALRSFS